MVRDGLRYHIFRDDVAEELQRREEAERQEQQEQQQAQQEAQDAAAAAEIRALLEQTIAAMNCETTTVTLTGYANRVIKLACDQMNTSGYTFGDFTSLGFQDGSDYQVGSDSNGVVTITNNKWAEAEIQTYLAQIDTAIDNGASSLTLQGGNYADRPDQPWYYASQAAARARANHTTPGGRVAGSSYTLTSSIDSATENLIVRITYPFSAMSDEEALAYFIGIFENAVRQGQTEVTIQESDGTRDYEDIVREAYDTVNYNDHEIDGLVAGKDYNIWTKSGSSNTSTWTIVYY